MMTIPYLLYLKNINNNGVMMIYTETYDMSTNTEATSLVEIGKFLSSKLIDYISKHSEIIILGTYKDLLNNSYIKNNCNCCNIDIKAETRIDFGRIHSQYDVDVMGDLLITRLAKRIPNGTKLFCVILGDCGLVTCTECHDLNQYIEATLNLHVVKEYGFMEEHNLS